MATTFNPAHLDQLRVSFQQLEQDAGGLITDLNEAVGEVTAAMGLLRDPKSWKLDNVEFETQLVIAEEQSRQLLTRTAPLLDLPGQVQSQLVARSDEVIAGVTDQFEQIDAAFEQVRAEVELLQETIPELLRDKLEEMEDALAEIKDEVEDKTKELWREAVTDAGEQWHDAIETAVEEQIERFTKAAGQTKEQVEGALEKLCDFALEELREAVREEARKVLDSALSRLQQEVVDGVVTSQLQVQLTAMMSPILPQLIVVRVVAGTIKRLLDILRMGF